MSDRGMIKWQPFNSVVSNKVVINAILKEKNKIKMPLISDDEMSFLESEIIDAYYKEVPVNITYFQNGLLLNIKSKIIKIDQVYKMVYLNNKRLLFKQIVDIKEE